jgi:uncharacterized protein (TIGR03437 family)
MSRHTLIPAFLLLSSFAMPHWVKAQTAFPGATVTVRRSANQAPVATAVSDNAGRFRLTLNEPGEYILEAVSPRNPGSSARGVKLKGQSRPIVVRDVSSGQPTGKRLVDNSLLEAGVRDVDGGTILISQFQSPNPLSLVGRLSLDELVTLSHHSLTFEATTGGPRVPGQTIVLRNSSAVMASWSATFEALGTRWVATLSKSAGSILGGGSDVFEFRPPMGLAQGVHHGFLRLRINDADGVRNVTLDVTVNVAAASASLGNTLVEGISEALLPRADGTYERTSFRVVNNTGAAQVYAPRAEAGLAVSPASLSVPAGGSGEFQVQSDPAVIGGRTRWQFVCVVIPTPTGERRRCYWKWNPPVAQTTQTSCTPTRLQPVILSTSQPIPRRGHALDLQYQVFDDCGRPATNYRSSLRLRSGAQEVLLTTTYVDGQQAVRLERVSVGGASLADAAAEQTIGGLFYPYFAATTVAAQIDVEDSQGLEGTVQTNLLSVGDSTAPQVAAGALVANSTYEQPSPLAPLGIFSLFGLVPGIVTTDTEAVPFPLTMAGLTVYIDGENDVPVFRVSNGQVTGIVPLLEPGAHVAHMFFNGKLSGGLEFNVAEANPAPIFADLTNGLPHLYDARGRLITESNPMVAGEIYAFYADSLGAVDQFTPVPGAGTPIVASTAKLACTVIVGNVSIVPEYCGYSPGAPALWQVNFKAPPLTLDGARAGEVRQVAMRLNQAGHEGTQLARAWLTLSPEPSPRGIVTFTTDPPNRGLQFTTAVNNSTATTRTDTFGPTQYQFLSTIQANVPNALQQNGQPTRYQFQTWTAPIAANAAGGSVLVGLSTPSVITARFQTQHRLTIVGTGTANGGGPLVGGYYVTGSQVVVTANCTGTVVGLLVQKGSAPAQLVQSPATILMDQPVTVTVVCGVGSNLTSCLTPPRGLIGWWPLDETSGTTANNLVNTNANGTYSGTTAVAGRVAGARSFTTGAVTVNNTSLYRFPASPTRAFAFDAWVRGGAALLNGTHHILRKRAVTGTGSQLQGYVFSINNGNLTLLLQDSAGVQRVFSAPTPSVANSAWHFVAASVDFVSNQGYLFFDGVPVLAFQVANGPFADISPTAPLEFGSFGFSGELDEIEIFERALSLAEAQDLFRAQQFGKCKSAAPPPVPVQVNLVNRPANCTQVTINGSAQLPASVPNNSQVTLNVTANNGGLANATVTIGGVSTTYTSFPVTFAASGDVNVSATCVNPLTTCVNPPSGMVGWYKLEETALPLVDSAANPANIVTATLGNPVAAGKVGRAWRALNANAALSAGSPAKYNFGLDSFAVDLWLRFDGGQPTPFSIVRKASATAGFNILVDNGVLRLDINNSLVWKGTRNIMADRQWHHVTVNVARPGGAQFIIDGQVDPFTQTAALGLGVNVNTTEPLILSGVEVNLDEVELFQRVLTVSEAQGLFLADSSGKCPPNSCPAGSVAPPPNMRGWWGFSPAAATSIPDLSGNGNAGTLNVRVASSASQVGPALTMDTTSFMQVPHSGTLNFGSGAMSIDLWIKPAFTPDVNPVLLAKFLQTGNSSESTGWSFALGPNGAGAGRLTFNVFQQGRRWAMETASPAAVPYDGNWHLVGLSYDGSTAKFYVDGVAVPANGTNKSGDPLGNTVFTMNTDTTQPLRFGVAWNSNTALKYTGEMDEVEIFNRALTDAEMLALFQAGTAGKCDNAPPSVAHTITTNPANLQIQSDGLPQQAAPQTVQWVAGTPHQLTAPSPQFNTAQDTRYTLRATNPWTATGNALISSTGAVASAPAVSTVYTANFDTAYRVTVISTGCAFAASLRPLNPGSASANPVTVFDFVNAGTVVSGQILPANGIISVTINGIPIPAGSSSISTTISAPTTIRMTCGAPDLAMSFVSRTTLGGAVNTFDVMLRVRNNGLAAANNAQVTTTVPNSTLLIVNPTPLGTIAPGQQVDYLLRLSLNSAGSFVANAAVSYVNAANGANAVFTTSVNVP